MRGEQSRKEGPQLIRRYDSGNLEDFLDLRACVLKESAQLEFGDSDELPGVVSKGGTLDVGGNGQGDGRHDDHGKCEREYKCTRQSTVVPITLHPSLRYAARASPSRPFYQMRVWRYLFTAAHSDSIIEYTTVSR